MGIEAWRKKDDTRIEVEAVRLNEANIHVVGSWCRADAITEIDPEHPDEMQPALNVRTSTGMERASLGMYVIRYGGAFLVSHNRPFEMVYEPVNRPAPPLESAGDSRKARGFADPFDQGRRF